MEFPPKKSGNPPYLNTTLPRRTVTLQVCAAKRNAHLCVFAALVVSCIQAQSSVFLAVYYLLHLLRINNTILELLWDVCNAYTCNASVRLAFSILNLSFPVYYLCFHWTSPRCVDLNRRSSADSIGHGGTFLFPHFYKWLGTGGTVSRRTANKKLAKLYWPPW